MEFGSGKIKPFILERALLRMYGPAHKRRTQKKHLARYAQHTKRIEKRLRGLHLWFAGNAQCFAFDGKGGVTSSLSYGPPKYTLSISRERVT